MTWVSNFQGHFFSLCVGMWWGTKVLEQSGSVCISIYYFISLSLVICIGGLCGQLLSARQREKMVDLCLQASQALNCLLLEKYKLSFPWTLAENLIPSLALHMSLYSICDKGEVF